MRMNFQPVMLSDPHLALFHSPRPCSLEGLSVLPPVWNKADLSVKVAASAPPLEVPGEERGLLLLLRLAVCISGPILHHLPPLHPDTPALSYPFGPIIRL